METLPGGSCWIVLCSPESLPVGGAIQDGILRAGDLLAGDLRNVDLRGGDPPVATWLEFLATAAYGSMRGMLSYLW